MYDAPPPIGCDAVPDGQRGEHSGGKILEVELLRDGRTAVLLDEAAGINEGVACEPWPELPIALTPPPPFRTTTQREAILEWGEALAAEPDRRDATLDLLRREPPHLRDEAPLTPVEGETAEAIVATLLRLDGSYVAVQGPPGSGKTHVGAHVIAELINRHRWRVGVVAQSHAVVENLLDRVVAAGVDASFVAKRIGTSGALGDWTLLPDKGVLDFVQQHRADGYALGGTAWTFSNRAQVPRGELDLLVIDEAGQFSLANTIAVAVGARNLLLLGDPQQLPQVSQGLHPEPVDTSALGWLSDGHDVLPDDLGYFLAETWRMHPALTASVSALSYEGRLQAREPETSRRRLDGVAPGLSAVPVDHQGDSVECAAEADRVVRDRPRPPRPPMDRPVERPLRGAARAARHHRGRAVQRAGRPDPRAARRRRLPSRPRRHRGQVPGPGSRDRDRLAHRLVTDGGAARDLVRADAEPAERRDLAGEVGELPRPLPRTGRLPAAHRGRRRRVERRSCGSSR